MNHIVTEDEPTPNRILDLEAGTALVVSDLHGDGDAYRRYRDHYLTLRASGRADYFILLGDLVHREGPPDLDASLKMLLDVMTLKAQFGDSIIMLLGNHELPHLYAFPLMRGKIEYTPRFEAALGDWRESVIPFLDSLPFFVRTAGGVFLCHAGGSAALTTPQNVTSLATLDHGALWESAAASLPPAAQRQALRNSVADAYGRSYGEVTRHYLSVRGPEDPRYDDFLIGQTMLDQPVFSLLWETFFTRNEHEYGPVTYRRIVREQLRQFSRGGPAQHVLVSGHIEVNGGYEIVGEQQLRLASATHASPREAGRCLLIDVAAPMSSAAELVPHLRTILD